MAKVSFEFVINGPPLSVNTAKSQSKKHKKWKEAVGHAAQEQWIRDGHELANLPIDKPMEVAITTYFRSLRMDVDNVVKPILDGLKGIVYVDDGDIYRLVSHRVDLKVFTEIDSLSPLVSAALEETQELVHIVLTWE